MKDPPKCARDQSEQEEWCKELVKLHACRASNKPKTWMEAVRLTMVDLTPYTSDVSRLQEAVHNQPVISPEYNNTVMEASTEPKTLRLGEINHDALMRLATYARWNMHGKMAMVLWAPGEDLGATCMKQ